MAGTALLRLSAMTAVLLAAVIVLDRVEPGFLLSEAVAQEGKPKKDTRETRRTPALRNKVYERLAEAQTLAEAKDYAGAAEILNDMISVDGKKALNSYELANVYNLHAFLSYAKEDTPGHCAITTKLLRSPIFRWRWKSTPDSPLRSSILFRKSGSRVLMRCWYGLI